MVYSVSYTCSNCGGAISERYYRVVYPEDMDVEICPNCPDVPQTSFMENLLKEWRREEQ